MLANLLTAYAQSCGLLRLVFSVLYALVSELLVIQPLLSGGGLVSCRLLVSLGDWGSKVIGGTAFQMREISQEIFSLTSCFLVSLQRRARWDLFPSL